MEGKTKVFAQIILLIWNEMDEMEDTRCKYSRFPTSPKKERMEMYRNIYILYFLTTVKELSLMHSIMDT